VCSNLTLNHRILWNLTFINLQIYLYNIFKHKSLQILILKQLKHPFSGSISILKWKNINHFNQLVFNHNNQILLNFLNVNFRIKRYLLHTLYTINLFNNLINICIIICYNFSEKLQVNKCKRHLIIIHLDIIILFLFVLKFQK
jgi:hypothetical protein